MFKANSSFTLVKFTLVLGGIGLILNLPEARAQGNGDWYSGAMQTLVELLGDDEFATREAAQEILVSQGNAAIPFVEQGIMSLDPEVARRSEDIFAATPYGQRLNEVRGLVGLYLAAKSVFDDPLAGPLVRQHATAVVLEETGLTVQRPDDLAMILELANRRLREAEATIPDLDKFPFAAAQSASAQDLINDYLPPVVVDDAEPDEELTEVAPREVFVPGGR